MHRLIVAIALVSLSAASCASAPDELSGFVRTPLPSVADIALPDGSAGGTAFPMKAPPGELLLVYFGYTSCPDVCPTTLADLKTALAALGDDAEHVVFAMETIDIERDTDAIITSYVQSFIPGAHGLRARDDATLRAAADAFGANYKVTKDAGGHYEVQHTALMYAVDDEGLIQVTWQFGTAPQAITNDLRILLRRV
jgi:protein SCO1/2